MSKRYPIELKQNIIDLSQQKIKSAPKLTKEYDIGYSTIFKWFSDSQKSPASNLTTDKAKAEEMFKMIIYQFRYPLHNGL